MSAAFDFWWHSEPNVCSGSCFKRSFYQSVVLQLVLSLLAALGEGKGGVRQSDRWKSRKVQIEAVFGWMKRGCQAERWRKLIWFPDKSETEGRAEQRETQRNGNDFISVHAFLKRIRSLYEFIKAERGLFLQSEGAAQIWVTSVSEPLGSSLWACVHAFVLPTSITSYTVNAGRRGRWNPSSVLDARLIKMTHARLYLTSVRHLLTTICLSGVFTFSGFLFILIKLALIWRTSVERVIFPSQIVNWNTFQRPRPRGETRLYKLIIVFLK